MESKKPVHYPRHILMIYPAFQKRALIELVLAIVIIAVSAIAVNYVVLTRYLDPTTLPTRMLIYQLILFVSYGVLLGIVCLQITHRIGGPLYLIKRRLDEATAKGTPLENVSIRKEDLLHDFVESYNQYVNRSRRS